MGALIIHAINRSVVALTLPRVLAAACTLCRLEKVTREVHLGVR